jgi:hypothetical protein
MIEKNPVRALSDILAEMLGDNLNAELTLDEAEQVLSIGVLAWNLGRLPEPARSEELDRILKSALDDIGAEGAQELEFALSQAIHWKVTHHPRDERPIYDFRFEEGANGSRQLILTLE